MAHQQLRSPASVLRARGAGDVLRQLCRALLLLLVLGVHQGAFLHELSHYEPASTQDEEHPQDTGGPCALCLAYAGVESGLSSASSVATLLTGLSFVLLAIAITGTGAAKVPARRNRGPPELR